MKKILVCINYANEELKLQCENPPSCSNIIINPQDEYALSWAIEQKKSQEIHITVLTVGTKDFEPLLKKSLACGADDAKLIITKDNNTFKTASSINFYLSKHPKFDLILFGYQSLDYRSSLVPSLVAATQKASILCPVSQISLNESSIIAQREIQGEKEIFEVLLPAIVAVKEGLIPYDCLKRPTMRGIMAAKAKQVEIIDSDSEEIRENKTYEVVEQMKIVNKSKQSQIVDEKDLDSIINFLLEFR